MITIGNIQPVAAKYVVTGLEEYDNNPCISALPALMDRKQAAKLMFRVPNCSDELRGKAAVVRRHALSRIYRMVLPLSNNLVLFDKLSRIMRDAYLHRNINDPAFWEWKNRIVQKVRESKGNLMLLCTAEGIRSNSHPTSVLLNGLPGSGKTFALKEILSEFYPTRVIQHVNKAGDSYVQIPYIFVQCPHLGSAKALLLSIIEQVALLTGTKAEVLVPEITKKPSAETLIPEVVNLVLSYSIGTIFVDEIETVRSAPSGGDQALMAFFVSLVNTAHTSLVLTANPNVNVRFMRDMKLLLRLSGAGAMKFDRLDFNSTDWQLFVKNLWKVQFTKKPTELSTELSLTLHNKSQGILKLATYLWDWTQTAAIEAGGDETITPRVIEDAFKENGFLVERIINGLSVGEHYARDTDASWLDEFPNPATAPDFGANNPDPADASRSGIPMDELTIPPVAAPQVMDKKRRTIPISEFASNPAVKKGRSSYQALKEHGWTASTAEFAC